MTDVLDLIPAVRDLLLADATVSGLVSTRVYDSEIPEGAEQTSMPRAAVILNAAGGSAYPGSGRQHYGKTRVDVFAYAETLKKSRQLYFAVYGALKFMEPQTRQGVLLKNATVQSKGITGRDPERQWPLTLSSWLILAAETNG